MTASMPCCIVLLVAIAGSAFAASRPPVIFVPGLTESDLIVHSNCSSGWKLFWPITNKTFQTEEAANCWFKEMPLYFNKTAKTFSNQPGVTVEVVGFGKWYGLGSFARIESGWIKNGWVPEQTLFAAPFDWRFSSNGLDSYFDQLKTLTETVSKSQNQKVVLLAASYGPQIALSFLHRMTQDWKDTYISWFVAESPVFSGAPLAMQVLGPAYQGGFDVFHFLGDYVNAGKWLMPRGGTTNTTYSSEEVLVTTPSKNYTASDYQSFLIDAGHYDRMDEFNTLINDPDLAQFEAPMVNTLVTYGYGIGTPGYFIYSSDFEQNPYQILQFPKVINASETGDSVVPLRSSLRGTTWQSTQAAAGKMLYHWAYLNQEHAYCVLEQGGPCFQDVVNLLLNGTVPHTPVFHHEKALQVLRKVKH